MEELRTIKLINGKLIMLVIVTSCQLIIRT